MTSTQTNKDGPGNNGFMALQAIQAVSVSSTAPPPVWASAQRARLLGPKPNATCPRPRQTRPALDQRKEGERAERKDGERARI